MKFRLLTAGFSVLILAACASTPEPVKEPVVTERKAPPAPKPAAPTPEPAPAPMVAENLGATSIPFTGPIPGSVDDFIFQSGGDSRVYFGYDQYDLSQSARDTLRQQASWLSQYPQVTAVIEGNADERGTREYNLALGARRADSVKSFLVSQGVSPSRLTTVSYGKERPIDARSSDTGWAKNRNGHTNLMTGTIG
jgi:peptidoglycan-associated lipoprotein